ncbi:GntR family transcriptional regulator [Streptomyces spinoverrucosus]|nr:GntR family transcriptional regulator [Streptomyces spinoverrucosus]
MRCGSDGIRRRGGSRPELRCDGVSRGTVRRALSALEAVGRVETRQGVGRVVRAAADEG